jgi:hypothetical protein
MYFSEVSFEKKVLLAKSVLFLTCHKLKKAKKVNFLDKDGWSTASGKLEYT